MGETKSPGRGRPYKLFIKPIVSFDKIFLIIRQKINGRMERFYTNPIPKSRNIV